MLLGIKEKLSDEAVRKLVDNVLPGTKVSKGMFNNTILHVTIPASSNVERAMTAFSSAADKGIKYAELNGIVSIQSPTFGIE